ncbi:MAG TPA: TerB family tellurite resistance protein [Rhodothermales bacterium]|nr:TerB family tellurite resistance protein [Rhodothermales bacterium]
MDTTELRTLLLRSVALAMACDGEVHEAEVAELRGLAGALPYFDGLDVEAAIARVRTEGTGEAIEAEHLAVLARTPFKERQRFAALEALLAVVAADGVLHPAERSFVRRVKGALAVGDEAFITRFPEHSTLVFGRTDEAFTPLSPFFSRPPPAEDVLP